MRSSFKTSGRRAARAVAALAVAFIVAETMAPGGAGASGGEPGEPVEPTPLQAVLDRRLSRYEDNNADGRLDPARTAGEAQATNWPVRLSACRSTPRLGVTYTWNLAGTIVKKTTCSPTATPSR